MNHTEFRETLGADTPPVGIDLCTRALWYQAKGDWHKAHTLAQEDKSENGAWVHAHLHRVEGDESNAGYWYRRANKPHSTDPLDEEWDAIAAALLSES